MVSVLGMGGEVYHQLFAVRYLSPVLDVSHSLAYSGPCLAVSTICSLLLSVDCCEDMYEARTASCAGQSCIMVMGL